MTALATEPTTAIPDNDPALQSLPPGLTPERVRQVVGALPKPVAAAPAPAIPDNDPAFASLPAGLTKERIQEAMAQRQSPAKSTAFEEEEALNFPQTRSDPGVDRTPPPAPAAEPPHAPLFQPAAPDIQARTSDTILRTPGGEQLEHAIAGLPQDQQAKVYGAIHHHVTRILNGTAQTEGDGFKVQSGDEDADQYVNAYENLRRQGLKAATGATGQQPLMVPEPIKQIRQAAPDIYRAYLAEEATRRAMTPEQRTEAGPTMGDDIVANPAMLNGVTKIATPSKTAQQFMDAATKFILDRADQYDKEHKKGWWQKTWETTKAFTNLYNPVRAINDEFDVSHEGLASLGGANSTPPNCPLPEAAGAEAIARRRQSGQGGPPRQRLKSGRRRQSRRLLVWVRPVVGLREPSPTFSGPPPQPRGGGCRGLRRCCG